MLSAMSEPMTTPPAGHFSWNELISTRPDESAAFYAKLFGWRAEPFVPKGSPEGSPPYTLFKTAASGSEGIAGMVSPMHEGAPTHWIPYIVVEDAVASVADATALGATVVVPVMPIGEVGRIAVIKDPQGAVLGLHEFPKPSA